MEKNFAIVIIIAFKIQNAIEVMMFVSCDQALFESRTLPRVISGTSAGSMVAACLCTRTDDEFRTFWTPEIARTITMTEGAWLQHITRFGKRK